MGILSQGWGRFISPYPLRFEPLLAEGSTRIIGPDGSSIEGYEDPLTGRLLRANFDLDPFLAGFFGTRAFGMDAGVSRNDAHIPFEGPGELRISALFRSRFRLFAVTSVPGTLYIGCDAAVRLYVEEFDQDSRFVRFLVPAELPVARIRPEIFRTERIEQNSSQRVLFGMVGTSPGNYYRIWADAWIAMQVHGGGFVRFEVEVPYVTAGFHPS